MNVLLDLFLTFFKIGAFTFGGGYAMLPMIESEVEAHGWMSMADLVDFVAVSESTPGPFAVNISTYVGCSQAGIPGGICATLGVILPSFIIILIVAGMYDRFKKSFIVNGCMNGLRPAVIGLISSTLLSVGSTVFFPDGLSGIALESFTNAAFLCSLVIFVVCAVLALRKVHPILLICLSAVAGIAVGYIFKIPIA